MSRFDYLNNAQVSWLEGDAPALTHEAAAIRQVIDAGFRDLIDTILFINREPDADAKTADLKERAKHLHRVHHALIAGCTRLANDKSLDEDELRDELTEAVRLATPGADPS